MASSALASDRYDYMRTQVIDGSAPDNFVFRGFAPEPIPSGPPRGDPNFTRPSSSLPPSSGPASGAYAASQSSAAPAGRVDLIQVATVADVNAARANVRAQSLTLGFTRVIAPISGRISQRRVDPGNAVTADQTVLTTIVSTDPLHFAFDGSEALLLRYQREHAAGIGSEVRIRLQDEGHPLRAPFRVLSNRMIQAIDNNNAGSPSPNFNDGLNSQIMLDAARLSTRTRSWVEL